MGSSVAESIEADARVTTVDTVGLMGKYLLQLQEGALSVAQRILCTKDKIPILSKGTIIPVLTT